MTLHKNSIVNLPQTTGSDHVQTKSRNRETFAENKLGKLL